jgi:hypothetical protein
MIVRLLLIFVIVLGASGIAVACPDGYYRCGTDLCCPK